MSILSAIFINTTTVIAGIGWDPEIRGLLTVAVASAGLMGTVWLLLATNVGVRLGSLVALTGFFGWFTIMSLIWWLFGIGYTGQRPSWEFVETVKDPAGAEQVGLEEFINLPDPNCNNQRIFPVAKTNWQFSPPTTGCVPRAIALVLEFDGPSRSAVIAELATVDVAGIRETVETRNALYQLSDPRYLNNNELNEEVTRLINIEETKIDQLSLSNLAATAPEVIRWAAKQNYFQLTDWQLLSTVESGEANNAAAAVINNLSLFPNDPNAATPDFIILDTYQKGGKPKAKSDGVWDRVTNRITNTFRVTHPTNEVVIQSRAVLPKPQVLGQAAPIAEVDPNSQTISVLMRRNLGNLRVTPGLLSLGSGLIFAAFALTLHLRHRKEEEANEKEAASS